jgi:N-acetylmuramoyl-L-alanine amidase
MPTRTCIMLGTGLFVVATGFAHATTLTTASQSVLRAGPGATFSVIGHMPAGTKLEPTDCRGGWCQVDFNGTTGFVGAADLGTARRIANSPRSTAENAHRSYNRVSHGSPPDRSVTRAARSTKSELSAHP